MLRQKAEAERLQIAWGMWWFAWDMLRKLLQGEQPAWSETQVQQYEDAKLKRPTGLIREYGPAAAA